MPEKPFGIHLKRDARLGLDPAKVLPESVKAEVREDPDGVPVANFVEVFGGYEGTVTDPFGRELSVSLAKWRHAPPKARLGLSLTYTARTSLRA